MKKYSIVAILFLLATITIRLCALQTKPLSPVEPIPKSPFYPRISRKSWNQRKKNRKRKKEAPTTDIWSAIKNNDSEWVKQQRLNSPSFVVKIRTIKNNKNKTPLHIAAKINDREIAAALSESGIDISATDTKGNTPLHTAALHGNFNVYDELALKDANLPHTAKNINGKTANDLLEGYQQNQLMNKIKYALVIVSTWVSNFIHAEMYIPPNNTKKTSSVFRKFAQFKSTFDKTFVEYEEDHAAIQIGKKVLEPECKTKRLIIDESSSDESSSSESEIKNKRLQEKTKHAKRQGSHKFYRTFREKAGPNFMENKKVKEYYEYLKKMPHHKRMNILKNIQVITPDSVSIPSYSKKKSPKDAPEIKISKKPGERPIDHFACWIIVRGLQILNFLWENKYTGPTVNKIINKQIDKIIKTKIKTSLPVKKIRVKTKKDNSSDDSEYETANVIHFDLSPLVKNLNINKKHKKENKADAEHQEFVTSLIKKTGTWGQYSGSELKKIKKNYQRLKVMPHAERMNIIQNMNPIKPGFSHYFKEEESEESDEGLLLPSKKGNVTIPGETYSDDETLQQSDSTEKESKEPGFFGKMVNKVTDALIVDINLDDLNLTGAVAGIEVTPELKEQKNDSSSDKEEFPELKPIETTFIVKVPITNKPHEKLATQVDLENLKEDSDPEESNEEIPLQKRNKRKNTLPGETYSDDEEELPELKPIDTTFIVKAPVTNKPHGKLATQIDLENEEDAESSNEYSDNYKKQEFLEFKETFWNFDVETIPVDDFFKLTKYFKQIGVLPHEQRMQKLQLTTSENKLECAAIKIRNKYQFKTIQAQSDVQKELEKDSDEEIPKDSDVPDSETELSEHIDIKQSEETTSEDSDTEDEFITCSEPEENVQEEIETSTDQEQKNQQTTS